MKKLLTLAAAGLLACLLLTGCTSVTGISLPATLEAEKGQPVELTPTYTYKNENASDQDKTEATEKLGLTFASSGPAVAVGADGSLTAAEGGTATVTASSADGKLSASCTVTVIVPVEKVEAPVELALALHDTESAALGAKVLPADASDTALTYTSSDEAVATVAADGTVTAVGKGTATITTLAQRQAGGHQGDRGRGRHRAYSKQKQSNPGCGRQLYPEGHPGPRGRRPRNHHWAAAIAAWPP